MNKNRRHLLKAGLAIGGASAFVAGYAPTTKHLLEGAMTGSSGEKPKHAHFGNSLEPEYQVKGSGQLIVIRTNESARRCVSAARRCAGCGSESITKLTRYCESQGTPIIRCLRNIRFRFRPR